MQNCQFYIRFFHFILYFVMQDDVLQFFLLHFSHSIYTHTQTAIHLHSHTHRCSHQIVLLLHSSPFCASALKTLCVFVNIRINLHCRTYMPRYMHSHSVWAWLLKFHSCSTNYQKLIMYLIFLQFLLAGFPKLYKSAGRQPKWRLRW